MYVEAVKVKYASYVLRELYIVFLNNYVDIMTTGAAVKSV
jgi:hypothetical protein